MSQLKEKVIEYLETEPRFRERKNKDRGIVNILLKRYSSLKNALEQHLMSKDDLTAIVQDYASLDRAWRKALEDDPRLRGSDYDEKDRLEAETMAKLGYQNPGRMGPMDAVEEDNQPTLL